VRNVIRFTSTSPPFSTNRSRAFRLVIETNASRCARRVRYPRVKLTKATSISPMTTRTSTSVEKACRKENTPSPMGRNSEKWLGRNPSFE
jgi:hypothetical protein